MILTQTIKQMTNKLKTCKCGCGQIVKLDQIFISHHQARGKFNSNYGSKKFYGKRKIHDWSGKNNPGYKHGPLTEEHKKKIHESCMIVNGGEKNYIFQQGNKLYKKYRYKNICFKSSWEAKYAQYLDKNKIMWYYEHTHFKVIINNKKTTYTPDFYLPLTNEYVEIKGYWREISKLKYNAFLIAYPAIKIKTLIKTDLEQLQILSNNSLCCLEKK